MSGENGTMSHISVFFLKAYNFKAITTGFSFRYKKIGTWKGRLELTGVIGVSRGGWS